VNDTDLTPRDANVVPELERWLASQEPGDGVDRIIERVLGAIPSVEQQWSWRWYQARPGSVRQRMRVIRLSAAAAMAAMSRLELMPDGVMGHIDLRPEDEYEVGVLGDELLITDVEGHVLARVRPDTTASRPGS
jgi:hypothetical protein